MEPSPLPPKQHPGRPKKKIQIVGRQRANLDLLAYGNSVLCPPLIAGTSLPTPATDIQPPVPPMSASELLHLTTVFSLPSTRLLHSHPASLKNNISYFYSSRSKDLNWVLLEKVRTLDIGYWFDKEVSAIYPFLSISTQISCRRMILMSNDTLSVTLLISFSLGTPATLHTMHDPAHLLFNGKPPSSSVLKLSRSLWRPQMVIMLFVTGSYIVLVSVEWVVHYPRVLPYLMER